MRRLWLLAAFLTLGVSIPAWPATPDTVFRSFTRLGDRILFLSFTEGFDQCGLWATDGTAAGTESLADLCATDGSSVDGSGPQILAVTGGKAFLTDFASRLWRTDGTAAGTFPLGIRVQLSTYFANAITGPDGRLYFTGCTEAGVCAGPWVSDATVQGTRILRAIQPDGLTLPLKLALDGQRVVFGAAGAKGPALWTTDGTGPGTGLFHDLCPGPCDGSPAAFSPALGRLLFEDGDQHLWVTDGTQAGTLPLARLSFAAPFSSGGLDLAEVNGRVVFPGLDEAGGSQPWVSDLTPEGTEPLRVP